jgi:hypothetical protein
MDSEAAPATGNVPEFRWREHSAESVRESWTDAGVSWYRTAPGAAKRARALVGRELPRRIAAWASRVAPEEPVYALALLHSIDDPTLPPALGLGTVAELERWKSEQPDRLRDYAWNPAEYRLFEPSPPELTEDAALVDAFAVLNQQWALSENRREPASTLRACARALLADRHWATPLTCADDFCVVVVPDEHDEQLTKHLRATISATTLRSIENPA